MARCSASGCHTDASAVAGRSVMNVSAWTARWLTMKWTPSVVQPNRKVFCCGRRAKARSSGMKTSASRKRFSRNQSSPSVSGWSNRLSIGTLPPPARVAASARPMPASPRTFRRRSTSETAPSRNARPIVTSRSARRSGIG
jgi:hypothetical protein